MTSFSDENTFVFKKIFVATLYSFAFIYFDFLFENRLHTSTYLIEMTTYWTWQLHPTSAKAWMKHAMATWPSMCLNDFLENCLLSRIAMASEFSLLADRTSDLAERSRVISISSLCWLRLSGGKRRIFLPLQS